MKDKRILFVSSEVVPYLPETELSSTAFISAKNAHSKGVQTRIFMPRYGVINERRHQLHEVIRLSGMNLVVNDVDMPLIIKVASIPKERMQLYLREFYKEEPLFTESKIVTSLYSNGFEGELSSDLANKIKFDLSENDKIATVKIPNHANILKSAIENSDAIIQGSETISEELSSFIEEKGMPVLEYESENLKESYLNFYADLLSIN